MSRLIIKNLPNGITEKRLRSVFEEKGTITDVQLKYAANGVFRKFAFVGFQREEDAQTALDYFNNTFIDTSRIQVEACRHLGDADKPRSWSQHSADSSRFSKAHPEKKDKAEAKKDKPSKEPEDKLGQLLRNPLLTDKEKEAIESLRHDPQFLEFFSINQRGKDTANKGTWSNDDSAAEFKSKKGSQTAKKTHEDEEETTEPKENFNKMKDAVKIKHLPKGVSKAIIRQFFVGLNPQRVHLPKKARDIAFVQFASKADVVKGKTFDKKQMLGQTVTVTECEKPADADEKVSSSVKEQPEVERPMDLEDSSIAEHGRLFARNLPFFATIEDIENLFGKYGPVSEVKLPTDFITKQSKGYAIVTFMMPEHAVKALSMDGKAFQGRTIHVMPAQPKPEEARSMQQQNGTESKFKKDKTKETKDNSAQAVHSWNSLFLGVNAVMDLMAKRYKVSKKDMLETNAGGQSAAVKVALGETQIVKETKDFLEENGVKLAAFSATKGPRSRTVMLVKNLPAGTPSSEVHKLFEPFGSISRLLLPPAGVTAIVEMLDSAQAKKAFRWLAYYKFGSVPLFLEWAPVDALSQAKATLPSKSQTTEQAPQAENTVTATPQSEKVEDSVPEVADEEDGNDGGKAGSSLFVKNLNFSTTDEALKNLFTSAGKVKSASVARKLGPKGVSLSMGYGFVQFRKEEDARKAIKTLQHCSLDGHALELKVSERLVNNGATSNAKRKSTKDNKQSCKIMVRNIPFQAAEKEIRDLFSVFGSLKSVRLPSKMGESGSHRGFCFVEYNVKADAKKAFEALSQSTHLYSRRLVLEWAADEAQDVDELRQRVGQHFHEDGASRKKLKKRHLLDELDKGASDAGNDMPLDE